METRYERLVKRAENPGDAAKTFEEFERDHHLDADARIVDLKNYADRVISNDGTYAEMYKQVDEIVAHYLS